MPRNALDQTPPRVLLSAEAFGFGPASKVALIAKELSNQLAVTFEVRAASVAFEFFRNEGLIGSGSSKPISVDDPAFVSFLNGFDLAIVGLDMKAAARLAPHLPVAFIDSLGFMWEREVFKAHPDLAKVWRYFAQDAFGSAARLRTIGAKNIRAIGAIVPSRAYLPFGRHGDVTTIHLGGVMNHFSDQATFDYCDRVIDLVVEAAERTRVQVLVSEEASRHLGMREDVTIMSCTHDETISAFQRSRVVFTSLGLTSTLELTALGVPVLPLLPQNYSQLLILRHVCSVVDAETALFREVASWYHVQENVPEAVGVAYVQARNQELLNDADFCRWYVAAMRESLSYASALPKAIAPRSDGVSECVQELVEFLTNSASSQKLRSIGQA